MYDDLSPQQRVKVAWICFIFFVVFAVLVFPFIILMRTLTSIDRHITAILEIVIIAPVSLLISIKAYNNKVLPLLAKRDRSKGGR